jgi:cytoskeletal protein RodZ
MSEEQIVSEDSSHYEVSLTAGQAFVAFVLLLSSLAAAFVFGLMVGKGQATDRLVVKEQPTVIEAGAMKKGEGRIVELGVAEPDEPEASTETVIEESPISETNIVEESVPPTPASAVPSSPAGEVAVVQTPASSQPERKPEPQPAAPAVQVAETKPAPSRAEPAATPHTGPVYAQVFSSPDSKAAESLAARLIDNGFTSAYVERMPSSAGTTYRVRVRFAAETQARASVDKLRALSHTEPWITRQ